MELVFILITNEIELNEINDEINNIPETLFDKEDR